MEEDYNTTHIVYNVCFYIRLSQADRRKNRKYESESESIKNQRSLLMDYLQVLKEKEYTNTFNYIGEYVDDGFSGTNFERPNFQKMIHDIERKKINLVFVKDISRLGRDQSVTSYYVDTFFPEKKVRFIAATNYYDTTDPNRQPIQFILAANDYFSDQNSHKIRDILNNKRKNGKFIGSEPCYGYMRDPLDKGHLIPDPKTAPIVKKIFCMANQNIGVSDITSYLNKQNYPTPSKYKEITYSTKLLSNDQWSIPSVNKILANRMYVGDMVQHVQEKVSYKSKKKVTLSKDNWIIKENTHEPLVDRETYMLIQRRKHQNIKNTKPTSDREIRLFESLLFCKECGNRLTVSYRKRNDYWSINCNKYSRDPKRRLCEPHFFPYNHLEEQLINRIDKYLSQYIEEIGISNLNKDIVSRGTRNTINYDQKIKEKKQDREKLSTRLYALYKDKCDGLITMNQFADLSVSFESEKKTLDDEIYELEYERDQIKESAKKVPDYTKQIRKLLNLKKPKRELLLALIEKIEIDKYKVIRIIFKYGMLEDLIFNYENITKPRNPYGRRGKSVNDKSKSEI